MKTALERDEEKQIPRRFAVRNDGRVSLWSDQTGLWVQVWATTGTAAWAGIAVLARIGMARVGESS